MTRSIHVRGMSVLVAVALLTAAPVAAQRTVLIIPYIFDEGFETGSTCTSWSATVTSETCNGQDDDCNSQVDDDPIDGSGWYYDGDGDTYGDPDLSVTACADPGADYVENGADCDDATSAAHPGGLEICDGLDNDCYGGVDDGAADADCDDGLDCTVDTCSSGSCDNAPDITSCVIDGVCVPMDSTNPADLCEVCDPATSQAGWSPGNEGGFCDDGVLCTDNDMCLGGGCIGVPIDCGPDAICDGGICVPLF